MTDTAATLRRPRFLPDLTLCAVSSVDPDPAALALRHCLDHISCAHVKLLSGHWPRKDDERIRFERIEPFQGRAAYSTFILKDLWRHIDTDFVLIVQWDGFVVDADQWDDRFLGYDYIGAPWPQFDDGYTVGNGGFSLRSKRLLVATADPSFPVCHPEDLAIGRQSRRLLEDGFGIRFAPEAVARHFSIEREARRPSFGFHGSFNFPWVFGDELLASLADYRMAQFDNRDGEDLCRHLLCSQHGEERRAGRRLARYLLRRRPLEGRRWRLLAEAGGFGR